MKNLSNTETELKKSVAYEKSVYFRHVTFPVFSGIPVFWFFFAGKSISEIHVKTCRKSREGGREGNRIRQERVICTSWITLLATVAKLLFTFVLLNEDVPGLETIYFVSIEQKKENCLQKLPSVLVIMKDEVICSANK